MPVKSQKISFITLIMMISFASINAVLFTPALPTIATFFAISTKVAQYTIIWFLLGYTFGQLIYGPIANRFGRKQALYAGIGLQIASSLFCVASGWMHLYFLLVLGRFLLALGSGVGLKMAFTLVNECYEPKIASQKIAYLVLAFAVTPALGVTLGGYLTAHFGWMSCFIAGLFYGLILLFFVWALPETQMQLDKNALKWQHMVQGYATQFRNIQLLGGGFLMGCCSAFVYAFAAGAPFVAINLLGMDSKEYGIANLLPSVGLVFGSLSSVWLSHRLSLESIVKIGIVITSIGALFMIIATISQQSAIVSLFTTMVVIYFGLSLVIANASTIALSQNHDKAHGSAVMNFINMGMATLVVLTMGFFSLNAITLPIFYLILSVMMAAAYSWLLRSPT